MCIGIIESFNSYKTLIGELGMPYIESRLIFSIRMVSLSSRSRKSWKSDFGISSKQIVARFKYLILI